MWEGNGEDHSPSPIPITGCCLTASPSGSCPSKEPQQTALTNQLACMREGGLEPPRQCHRILSPARLPVPPPPPRTISAGNLSAIRRTRITRKLRIRAGQASSETYRPRLGFSLTLTRARGCTPQPPSPSPRPATSTSVFKDEIAALWVFHKYLRPRTFGGGSSVSASADTGRETIRDGPRERAARSHVCPA